MNDNDLDDSDDNDDDDDDDDESTNSLAAMSEKQEENALECAIPAHFRVDRVIPASTPPNYIPKFPTFGVRYKEDVAGHTMVIIGAQFADRDEGKERAVVSKVTSLLTAPMHEKSIRPSFSEWTAVTDNRGFYNLAAIAYWNGHTTFELWRLESGFETWWQALEPEAQEHGWFLEIFSPSMDRFEAVFTDSEVAEGAAHLRHGMSQAVQEHGYWGSMRDRIPLAQTEHLDGEMLDMRPRGRGPAPSPIPKRIRVPGKSNLAVIRSGQDWRVTPPKEREDYLTNMRPVLQKGMDFLRDQGEEVGCYSCRLMDIVNPVTREADEDRSFGLAYFDDLSSMEKWSKEHPAHLAIFGGFLQYVARLKNEIKLRLYHEVLVLTPEQQAFEYVACHPETGMMVAARWDESSQDQHQHQVREKPWNADTFALGGTYAAKISIRFRVPECQ